MLLSEGYSSGQSRKVTTIDVYVQDDEIARL